VWQANGSRQFQAAADLLMKLKSCPWARQIWHQLLQRPLQLQCTSHLGEPCSKTGGKPLPCGPDIVSEVAATAWAGLRHCLGSFCEPPNASNNVPDAAVLQPSITSAAENMQVLNNIATFGSSSVCSATGVKLLLLLAESMQQLQHICVRPSAVSDLRALVLCGAGLVSLQPYSIKQCQS
jgi:hypothetical protein